MSNLGGVSSNDDMYTTKVSVPQYEIKGVEPELSALVNQAKTEALLQSIEGAEIPDEVKDFLRLLHIAISFSTITILPSIMRMLRQTSSG